MAESDFNLVSGLKKIDLQRIDLRVLYIFRFYLIELGVHHYFCFTPDLNRSCRGAHVSNNQSS